MKNFVFFAFILLILAAMYSGYIYVVQKTMHATANEVDIDQPVRPGEDPYLISKKQKEKAQELLEEQRRLMEDQRQRMRDMQRR